MTSPRLADERSPPCPQPRFSREPEKLEALSRRLKDMGYEFTTVTPETHELVNSRPTNAVARSVADVFGWSRPFVPAILPDGLFELARDAGACEA